MLRLSKSECLFGGKSTISFHPYQLGHTASLNELVTMIRATEDLTDLATAPAIVQQYVHNFFTTHLAAEKYAASLHGLAERDTIDIDSSVTVGTVTPPPFINLDIQLQSLAAQQEKDTFAQLESPADATVAVSIYLSLQDKANDFAVGQLTGMIKQLVDLAVQGLPNKDTTPFRGLKGKIEKDSAGKKQYRFTLFFAEAVAMEFEEFKFFQSLLLTLQLGAADPPVAPAEEEAKAAPAPAPVAEAETSYLPEFSRVTAAVKLQAAGLDPLFIAYLSRLGLLQRDHGVVFL